MCHYVHVLIYFEVVKAKFHTQSNILICKIIKNSYSLIMREAILKALEDKYNAEISEADATIKIYLENSVGIGEHPQHIEECDKLIGKIAEAEDKLQILKEFK